MISPSPPQAISGEHDLTDFCSGEASLDNWLRGWALRNHRAGFTHVRVVAAKLKVVGYYGVSATSISVDAVPRRLRGGQPPDPLAAFLIGRFAVDRQWKGLGLGSDLLRNALEHCAMVADVMGGRLAVVRALHERAAAFYRRHDFVSSNSAPLLLMNSIQRIRASSPNLDYLT